MEELPEKIEGIPTGKEKEDIRIREKIITLYYVEWRRNHPDEKVYNTNLDDYIYVVYLSMDKTRRHAAKRYLSTLAVLHLEEILGKARIIQKSVPIKKGSRNQKGFSKLIRMEYHLEGLGAVKLMVGVKRKTGENIQYCLTVTEQNK